MCLMSIADESALTIAVLGAGVVGRTLAAGWAGPATG